jgi:hypothetical protein
MVLPEMNVSFDYLTFSFPEDSEENKSYKLYGSTRLQHLSLFANLHFKEISRMLKLDLESFTVNRNISHYDSALIFGENIYVKYMGPENIHGLKTHSIELSGGALRELEENDIDYMKLLYYIYKYEFNVSRIDICNDIFTPKYFTIEQLVQKTQKNEYISIFKNHKIIDGGNKGVSIYYGSRDSNQMNFYDKKYERIYRGKEVTVNFWLRLELRFKSNKSRSVINHILALESIDNLPILFKELISSMIEYKSSRSSLLDIKDRPTWRWWERYLGVVNNIKITNQAKLEDSISRSYKWLVNTSFKKMIEVFTTLTPEEKSLFIDHGLQDKSEKLDNRDFKRINQARIKKGLKPYEDKTELLLDVSINGFGI